MEVAKLCRTHVEGIMCAQSAEECVDVELARLADEQASRGRTADGSR